MRLPQHMAGVLGRVLYLQRLRTAALILYGRCDDHKVRTRASVVARDVARAVDAIDSQAFRADLTHALRAAGWRSVKPGNVRQWLGVHKL